MEYEIDFLPVGEESKGGDAICFRYWDSNTPQFVGVIDGGTTAAGNLLVEHIQQYYHTTTVDLVINTHPHADHTCGLYTVLEELDVKHLMMHKPWEHAPSLKDLFHDGRMTTTSIEVRVREALQHARDLEEIAIKKKIRITEPFAGVVTPSPFVKILGPTLKYYKELLIEFTATSKSASFSSLYESILKETQLVVQWAKEAWDSESLSEPTEGTNAENNSSVITLLDFGNKRLLFTGDAGVPALEWSCAVAEYLKIPLQEFKFVQIPHHGSKRNVGPTILNRLIGSPVTQGTNNFTAFVSVPKKGEPKHPSKRVTNAFMRRGAKVIQTKGSTKNHSSSGAPDRAGWHVAEPIPFHIDLEDDDSD